LVRSDQADILFSRGELDEALRILTEEELPVYERLGDVRELAVTQGKIAQILHSQGQAKEAYELHMARLQPMRILGSMDDIAHIQYCLAKIEAEEDRFEQARERLGEAWSLYLNLGRPDMIGFTGLLLGKVLSKQGEPAQGVQILRQAEAAFLRIGWEAEAGQCRALAEQIGGDVESAGIR